MGRSHIYTRDDRKSLYIAIYDPYRREEFRESAHTDDPRLASLRLAELEAQVALGTYVPPRERAEKKAREEYSLHCAVADYVTKLVEDGATRSHFETSAYHLFHLLEFAEYLWSEATDEVPEVLPHCRLRIANRRATAEEELERLLAPAPNDCPVRFITPGLLDRFRNHRYAVAGASVVSVNGSIKVTKSFGRWLVDREHLPRNPCRTMRLLPNRGESRRRCLTVEEVVALGRSVRPSLKEWFLVCVLHGLRKMEVATLRSQDIDLEHGCIRIRTHRGPTGEVLWEPKYRRVRNVPIVEAAMPLMKRVAVRTPDAEGHLFGRKDHRRALASTIERAGIGGHVTPHDLRHTAYTHLKDSAYDHLDGALALADIRYIFGHGDKAMDAVYDHRGIERLRKLAALSALPAALLG